ncbi:MAG TPA: phosphoribosyltransferase [Phycisphaerales bacterium]|nr:phosphoribosyltransferase [Phycisphaerales bacterium]
MALPFVNREDAGRQLAAALVAYGNDPDLIVLGLPRGGVVVAFEVAGALHAPLDVFVVRKLGVPGFEELAFGAIASGGQIVLNQDVMADAGLTHSAMQRVIELETAELERRERLFHSTGVQVQDKIVILVDDGLATGATMRVGIQALRQMQPRRIVAAVPVGAPDIVRSIGKEADEIVCVETPTPFGGVGRWYDDFSQTTDTQVRHLLERAHAGHAH